jgi:hypothetical protein
MIPALALPDYPGTRRSGVNHEHDLQLDTKVICEVIAALESTDGIEGELRSCSASPSALASALRLQVGYALNFPFHPVTRKPQAASAVCGFSMVRPAGRTH